MTYKGLTTIMRETSAAYAQEDTAKEYMNNELNILEQQKTDIINTICMPAARVLESVIEKWQDSYVGASQTINPGGANWSGNTSIGWEYRSPISHSKSDLNETTVFGDPLTPSSVRDNWTIEQWKIWNKSGSGAGASWTRLDSSSDALMSSVAFSDLTDAILTSLGFSSDTALSKLQEYIDQWDMGIEWLHAKPSEFSPFADTKTTITDNPYAGNSRTFGVIFQIESISQGRSTLDTNTAFKKKLAGKWDQLLA